jgi:molybdopterin converting factor small subunit
MYVRVQALGGLASSDLVQELELPAGTRVGEAASFLRLPLKKAPFLLYIVNGKRVEETALLHEGDSLILFPPVLGG